MRVLSLPERSHFTLIFLHISGGILLHMKTIYFPSSIHTLVADFVFLNMHPLHQNNEKGKDHHYPQFLAQIYTFSHFSSNKLVQTTFILKILHFHHLM